MGPMGRKVPKQRDCAGNRGCLGFSGRQSASRLHSVGSERELSKVRLLDLYELDSPVSKKTTQ